MLLRNLDLVLSDKWLNVIISRIQLDISLLKKYTKILIILYDLYFILSRRSSVVKTRVVLRNKLFRNISMVLVLFNKFWVSFRLFCLSLILNLYFCLFHLILFLFVQVLFGLFCLVGFVLLVLFDHFCFVRFVL